MSLSNIFWLCGGLGLFLYGMKLMGDGLELIAGAKLKRVIEILTKNKFMGVLVGVIVTAVIQSSSATTVMVVGFVNAGIMNLVQATSVIMGANIGTTVTSWLIALNPRDIAGVATLLGTIMILFIKRKRLNHIGYVACGLGVLFIGLALMSDAMSPLKNSEGIKNAMVSMQHAPLLGLLAGIAITAIIQSSSASVAILQVLANQGLVPIGSAVYIIFGQNIGTCVTAMLASVGTNRTARRASVIHLLFNVIGSVIFTAISYFTTYTLFLSKITLPLQIPIAHLIFNISMSLLLLPFSKQLVAWSDKLVPGKDEKAQNMRLEFVDSRILAAPAIAVSQLHQEILRMATLASVNLTLAVESFVKMDINSANKVKDGEELINFLNHEISEYLIKIQSLELSDEDSRSISAFFHATNDLERLGDHAMNISKMTLTCIENRYELSLQAREEISEMHNSVMHIYAISFEMFENLEFVKERAEAILELKRKLNEMEIRLQRNHVDRLKARKCTPELGFVFQTVLADLERASAHARNLALALMK